MVKSMATNNIPTILVEELVAMLNDSTKAKPFYPVLVEVKIPDVRHESGYHTQLCKIEKIITEHSVTVIQLAE